MNRNEMTEIEVIFPKAFDADAVVSAIERAGANEALHLTMKTTLKKYPGCTHWHFKTGEESGVLEVTWWPDSEGKRPSRLWLSAHNNRQADWMLEIIPRLKKRIEDKLSAGRRPIRFEQHKSHNERGYENE